MTQADATHIPGSPPEEYLAFCREGEQLCDLQRNGLWILQHPDRFCFGMDAVLLSDYAASGGKEILDLGTGTGIIPLLLSAKTEAEHITGLEIQHESAEMAQRSVRMNGLEGRITIREGDLREADRIFAPASFDVITCNPPYMLPGHGLPNPKSPKAIARHEVLCRFVDVVRTAKVLLRTGGHLCLVHRPFRLAELITALTGQGLEPKRMRLVYPFADREPNLVLLDCVKGGRSRLQVEKPLIVYETPGKYTEEILKIYYEE